MHMLRWLGLIALAWVPDPLLAAEKNPAALTPEEIRAGWINLFDGETLFGWNVDGPATVKDGAIRIAPGKPVKLMPTAYFGPIQGFQIISQGTLRLSVDRTDGTVGPVSTFGLPPQVGFKIEHKMPNDLPSTTSSVAGSFHHDADPRKELKQSVCVLETDGKSEAIIYAVRVRPFMPTLLFNGKDLTGWKKFEGDPKRVASRFEVTPAGELHVKNGPGDLQTTGSYDNFCLQLECKTNGKALNSGIFFRCIPDQYQNGYEMQIQNAFLNGDRTKPADFGSGAIYRRIAARKVVADDNDWFAMTLLANGPRLRTWVNGYPTVDWVDERKANDNPRQGLRTAAGHLSIQGHDPTTDLLFRDMRIGTLPK